MHRLRFRIGLGFGLALRLRLWVGLRSRLRIRLRVWRRCLGLGDVSTPLILYFLQRHGTNPTYSKKVVERGVWSAVYNILSVRRANTIKQVKLVKCGGIYLYRVRSAFRCPDQRYKKISRTYAGGSLSDTKNERVCVHQHHQPSTQCAKTHDRTSHALVSVIKNSESDPTTPASYLTRGQPRLYVEERVDFRREDCLSDPSADGERVPQQENRRASNPQNKPENTLQPIDIRT